MHTLDLSLAHESKVPSGIGANKLSSRSMFDAFESSNPVESLAWLRTSFPNLRVVLKVLVDDPGSVLTQTGTLYIPKNDQAPLTLRIDESLLPGETGLAPRFPLPNNTETVYDLILPSGSRDAMTTYNANPPITASIHLTQSPLFEPSDDPSSEAYAVNTAHVNAHKRPIPKMSFNLRSHALSNPYLEVAKSLRRKGLIGTGGLTEFGSYHVGNSRVPRDNECLTDQSLFGELEGLKHWSLTVSQSPPSDSVIAHSDKPLIVLPKSLRQISLEYKHGVFPEQKYMSRLAQLLDDVDPEMTLNVHLICDMPSRCQDDHDGGYGSVLASKRRQLRSERIERTERSNVTAKTDDEIAESAEGKMVSISTHVS